MIGGWVCEHDSFFDICGFIRWLQLSSYSSSLGFPLRPLVLMVVLVGYWRCWVLCGQSHFITSSAQVSYILKPCNSFLLGVGIGAEYPCGSVSASEFSESPGISRRAQHRWYVLATSAWFLSGIADMIRTDPVSVCRYSAWSRKCDCCLRTLSFVLDVSDTKDLQFTSNK